MSVKRVGFIGGGKMATAMALGAVAANVLQGAELAFADPNEHKRDFLEEQIPGALTTGRAVDLIEHCDRLIIAVKPHAVVKVAKELGGSVSREKLLISIVAGIGVEQIGKYFRNDRVIRIMPNTPMQVGAGACGVSVGKSALPDDVKWVEQLLEAVGICEVVPDHLMHAVTGVAGSSPAYIYQVIEAMSDGGVAQGLPRDVATRLAAQAVAGAAQMVLQTGMHPGQLKDQVTSPGGTTIRALASMEKNGVRSAFIEAIDACVEQSIKLEES